MSAFSFRRAPGMRWTPRLPQHQSVEDKPHATAGFAPLARGTSETSCGLALPLSFALRLDAHRHVTPRNPACCPLEDTALRQWCVRLRSGACPMDAPAEAHVFLQRTR
ncbi:hypothetical protein [Paraburkholderia acidiphila]|uniref:Uncharacterized protein n=1 Tax=Paraburkholderia acidiphila TaxID=2571747 RepID=A0A7Z2JB67_9BURK|nr:hypothetical protein [Paraburkholderia acidiphila]QGZ57204.1 hypothetical protein FAZ97_19970 [Paraburkholderia acidiphila]